MPEASGVLAGERLQAAQRAFEAVVELPPKERREELRRICADDASLMAFVERLLQSADAGMGSFLETTIAAARIHDALESAPAMPARIGPYELVRRIGEGGMGIVYEARQEHPHRTVALKVIRPGFSTPALLRRFQFEAEVLGQLQHPGIAHIYEAGVADGVAYFAMEFIRGRPLGEYVASMRLDRRAILELVAQICDAVHHAHQKGVIHRDLKPGNILVSHEATEARSHSGEDRVSEQAAFVASSLRGSVASPKILDFGVARAVSADLALMSLHTEVGQLVGTVPYMSPEQVGGDSQLIDVRSDVYALGVILYELLAGRLPHDVRNCSIPEAARIIREEEPSRLSSINFIFRGDIETIVSKALEKDRNRRYQSAAELAADIRHCLRDEPIVARPASALYHLAKFARRHRAFVVGLATTLLTLVLGAAVAVMFAVRERQQRWRADEKTVESERLAYRANLSAASGALQTGDVDVARRVLAEAPSSLRGWEWAHLHAVADQSLMTLRGHTTEVTGIVCSNDGRRIVTTDKGGRLCVWDGLTGELVRTDHLVGNAMWGWTISPDGRMLIRCNDGSVTLAEDLDTGAPRWRLDASGPVRTGSFLPDGSAVALPSAVEPLVRFVEPDTGRELRVLRTDSLCGSGAILNADGSLLACVRGPIVTILDVATGGRLHSFESWLWKFSASPEMLYIWTQQEGLREVDARTGKTRKAVTLRDQMTNLVERPDELVSAVWSRKGPRLALDRSSGAILAELQTHSRMSAAEYVRDRNLLVTAGTNGEVKLWRASASPTPFLLRSGWLEEIGSAAVSPDGQFVVGAGWGVVGAYDAQTGALRWRRSVSRRTITSVAFDSSGNRIALGGERGLVLVMDRDGRLLSAVGALGGAIVRSACFTPDGTHIIVGCDDGTIRIVESEPPNGATAPSVRPISMRSQVVESLRELRVSPFGPLDRLDGRIIGIAVSESRKLAAIAVCRGGMTGAAAPADGGPRGWVRLTDLRGAPIATIGAKDCDVLAVAFSPDGSKLAIGAADHRVAIWDVDARLLVHELTDAGAAVLRLTFSPDGSRLVAGCEDGTFHVWSTATGDHLVALPARCDIVLDARFSPDGATLLAAARSVPLVVFESSSSAESDAAREDVLRARAVAEPFFSRLRFGPDVIAELQADRTLSHRVRESVIAHLRLRGENVNWMNSDAWGVVRVAGATPAEYERALRQARLACEQCPGEPALLNTLGTALYRATEFAAAIDTLRESDSLYVELGRGEQPANWAVIALSYRGLGDVESARRALERARDLQRVAAFRDDSETASLIDEAIRAVDGPGERQDSRDD